MANAYTEKLRSIGFLSRGRSRAQVTYGRDAEGARTKTTTDEHGNEVTEHDNAKDQVDVKINDPQTIRLGRIQ